MQNQSLRNKALTAALLRGCVAGYLIYLGWQIITNQDTEMSALTADLLGGGLIAAAAAFAVYILLRLKQDLHTADSEAAAEKDGGQP